MNWLEKARAVTPVFVARGKVDIGRARGSAAKALRKAKEEYPSTASRSPSPLRGEEKKGVVRCE